jgi:signal transduction histidine kinase/CheY-like chemotaxis protein
MGSLAIQPNSKRAFALAVALLVAALLLQWTLRPVFGNRLPFLFFFPAIGIAAMWGGWRPAAVVLVGGLVNATFWMEASGAFGIDRFAGRAALAGYLLAGGVLVAMGARMNQLRVRAVEAEDALAGQVQDLQGLHVLSSEVTLLPALEGQLQAVLHTLCDLHAAPKGLVYLRDEQGHTLRPVASVGFGAQALQELGSVPAGAGACGMAFQTGAPVIVEDAGTDACFEAYRALVAREGFKSVHSRPLLSRNGEVLGVISLHFPERRTPTAREQRLADLCARMASVLAERDAALREATAVSSRLEVALETAAVPFCLLLPETDDDGLVTGFKWDYVNAAAARMLRRPAEEAAGRPVRDLPGGASLQPGVLARSLEALQTGKTVQFETWVDAAGQRRWFNVIASPYGRGLAVWFSDMTARKRGEEQLREADRRKDEFLATLAHELRNPLAPIRQAAMIARSPGATDAQKTWSHQVIERQVAHMARLLDDLLDVSRITRGKLELRRDVIELRGVVDAALEATRPLVEAKRQQLHAELPEQPLWLDADPMRLAQILTNLVTNASKYTLPQGHITLRARTDGGEVLIEVRDDGMGIPPESLDGIFEMFTQVRAHESASAGGLGIGLALSRGLVQLHGGTLTAASPGLGQGSTFTVRLPLAVAPQPPASQEARQPAAGRSTRILVADDNRDAAESLADLLRMEGHEVAVAFDGNQALAEFNRFGPRVALLDIGMPGLTGNQVASAIRQRPEGAGTVLVAITGWGQERDRHAAREAGFDFHFTKPVDPLQVLDLLDKA